MLDDAVYNLFRANVPGIGLSSYLLLSPYLAMGK